MAERGFGATAEIVCGGWGEDEDLTGHEGGAVGGGEGGAGEGGELVAEGGGKRERWGWVVGFEEGGDGDGVH